MRRKKAYLTNQKIIFYQFLRKFKSLPRPIQVAFVVSLTTSALIYGSIVVWYFTNDLTDPIFLGLDKCNACFGKGMCPSLLRGDVVLKGVSGVRVFDHINVKNVFYAVANSSVSVVLKKLAHTSEFREIDERVCQLSGFRENCDLDMALAHSKPYKEYQLSTYALEKYTARSMSCISQRLLDRFQETYEEKLTDFRVDKDSRKRFIYTLMVNPEPFLLKTFPRTKGYPFPKLIGLCGRFLITENAGTRLSDLYNADWLKRIDIAWQLLKMADKFTKGTSDNFKLYWTDVSYENIYVNHKGEIIIVDLEDIVITDVAKIMRDKNPPHHTSYNLEFTECKSSYGDCIEYSMHSLCSQTDSDLNYFALCRNLLSSYANHHLKPGGFLHDLPASIEQTYKIKNLLEECAKPSLPSGRWQIKDKLLEIFKRIKDNHS